MLLAIRGCRGRIERLFRRPAAALRLGFCLLLATAALVPATCADAQTMTDIASNRANNTCPNQKKRLTVEAREMVYDNDYNIVTANGDVILYYDGRKLEADHVIYDRNTHRVFAQGNAKMTEADGTISYGDRFELTDDFKDGFIDSLRLVTKAQERFSAPRAERTDGETTVFDSGIYTACQPCAEHPERPPLWQVRSARIIHKNSEQTVYYENATVEFFGLPMFYMPLFSAPDPSVSRRSGFLTPVFSNSNRLGFGTKISYFWAAAPNYDITFSPTVLTRQGLLGDIEWRHRLENGQYSVRLAGISQLDRTAFLAAPAGAQEKKNRGSIESTGKFYINKEWSFGWDVALQSDRYFFHNYRVRNGNNISQYIDRTDATSTVYLNGQTPKAWLDLRGYYFQGTTVFDWQKQSPIVGPVLDYNRHFQAPSFIGGDISLTTNFTNIHRDQAAFSQLNPGAPLVPGGPPNLPGIVNPVRLLGYYDSCASGAFSPVRTTNQPGCLLRGIAGDYSRASTELAWRRQFTDNLGEVWTPFASARVDAAWINLNSSGGYVDPWTGYQNALQNNFIDPNDRFVGRAMPTIGLTYRFPFVAVSSWGNHVIEPIAQIIAAPDESHIGQMPNEDAQSLVFDDTNLFSTNRFSGFDREEGGTRANAGVQYTGKFDGGGYVNALFGQSYHLAGRNSFELYPGSQDLANTGADSGLDKSRSDYVGRLILAPNNTFSIASHARFDSENFSAKRIDVVASKSFSLPDYSPANSLSTSISYTRILPQPLIGYDQRREGIQVGGQINLRSNWFVNANVLFDLDRGQYNAALNKADGGNRSTSIFNLATTSFGFCYKDECTTFSFIYTSSYTDIQSGSRTRDNQFLVRLELKHLGDLNYHAGTDTSNTVR